MNSQILSILAAGFLSLASAQIVPAKLIKKVTPDYPLEAKAAGAEGRVVLYIEIGPDGVPRNIRVASPLGYGLDEAAVKAVSKWRYEPVKVNGKPVTIPTTIDVYFNLEGARRPVESKEFWRIEQARTAYNIGVRHLRGEGVEKSPAIARIKFQESAEQGFALAQFALAEMLHYGDGGDADQSKALEWYRKAAEQKHSSAEYNLGLAYKNGNGVAKDLAEARTWFTRSAEHGEPAGQFHLGLFLRDGTAGKQDLIEALAWLRLAAHKIEPARREADQIESAMSKQDVDRAAALAKKLDKSRP